MNNATVFALAGFTTLLLIGLGMIGIAALAVLLTHSLLRLFASVDTLPKGRDAKQGSVRSKGSAVRDSADAQKVQP